MALPVVIPVLGVAKEMLPAPSVCKTWLAEPSDVGNVNAPTNEVRLLSYACTVVPMSASNEAVPTSKAAAFQALPVQINRLLLVVFQYKAPVSNALPSLSKVGAEDLAPR